MIPAPDSYTLIAALVLGGLLALSRVGRARRLVQRFGCGALALTLAFLAGVAAVNTYYGY